MNPERRAAIVKILEESGAVFHGAVAGVPEERLRVCPGIGRWSVFEIVEHVAVAEIGMFRLLRSATLAEMSLENPEKEALLAARIGSRESLGKAPERAHPKGRFADCPEALAKFRAAREQTIGFASDAETDLFWLSAAHPLFGSVNGFELLLIMAGHARRHADQIAEVRRALS